MLFEVVGAGTSHEVQSEESETVLCVCSEVGVTEYVFVTVKTRTLLVVEAEEEEDDSVCSWTDFINLESSDVPDGAVPMTSSVKLCSGDRFTRLPETSAPGSVPVRVRVSTLGMTSSEEVVVTVWIMLYVLLEAGSKNVVVYVPMME